MSTAAQHLSVPAADRDMEWLKSAMQSAIELEHATLPLYLSSMFSLKVQNYTTYNLIRSVAMEEMVHMAIACNILAAIGGTPQIGKLAPKFPGQGLPGGAEPDLVAVLAKLSPQQVRNFMRLELPTFLVPEEYRDEKYPTIGAIYAAIRQAITDNADAVRAAVKKGGSSNQVGDNIGFTTIKYSEGTDPVAQLDAGINEIIEQGEGSPTRTLHAGAGSEGELSHYGKYAEISYGARYQLPDPPVELTPETEPEFFKGYPLPWPEVTNTLAVPSDGYEKILAMDPDAGEVKQKLLGFDQTYTGIMTDLEQMWNGPADKSWPTFGKAVGAMVELRVLCCFYIMPHQIPVDVVQQLKKLYPDEYGYLSDYTDLTSTVYYGPRFKNLNVSDGES